MPRLFRFRIGQHAFALPAAQVERLIDALEGESLPFAPEVVQGIARLEGRTVTLLDFGERRPDAKLLLVRLPDDLGLAAWRIAPGAALIEVPGQMQQADPPPGIDPAIVHAVFSLGGEPVVLMRPEGCIDAAG